ncbi:TonB-dependent receptor [Gemmatimonas sp.]|uniref:TonB-dependent receptor n=1 Tax=Gemmatimonas sp. TaxID=1962908 RepID=UPI00286AA868|nr:TonB-dependent receptor [Gemmatimonas sp.]
MRNRVAVASVTLLALASTSATMAAQNAPVTRPFIDGVVVARDGERPVPLATITVEGTAMLVRSDSAGRFRLLDVPVGPQVVVARQVGYAVTRQPVIVTPSGRVTLRLMLAVSSLQLDGLIVTADRVGRARGEVGTASVIDRDAIANQVAASLQGILELVPGVPLSAPGLDGAQPFALRTLAEPGAPSGAPSAGSIGSSGTLIILDGIPLSNNANLQSVGVRGEVVPSASTAGQGIDLRRIPATALERVEVIRGVPSARWGDLTQGAIIVDTRATATAPEFAFRNDPRTKEGNTVGGRSLFSERQQFTATLNVTETQATRSLSNASTIRTAAQLAHRVSLGGTSLTPRVTADSRLDVWRLRYDAPERIDLERGRTSFQDDYGVRFGERARWQIGARSQLEWTAAVDVQQQRTREQRLLIRPASPFTDRLVEGRQIGSFLEGQYLGAYELLGAPRLAYSRLEYRRDLPTRARADAITLRAGLEHRREWNDGDGYQFDLLRPPQASNFNGVNGYDRPRRFSDLSALTSTAAYIDARGSARVLGVPVEVQAGLRTDLLHDGGWWWESVRSTLAQPRLAVQVTPRPWIRLRGGVGVVGKLPTVAQLSPSPQYFDVVNVNRYPPNPSERLAVLTTFIRDPRNATLGIARARKQEVGFELDGGARRGMLSVTAFRDAVVDAVISRREVGSIVRERFTLVDTGLGSGRPGRIIEPARSTEPVPIFLDRFVNAGRLGSRGVEVVAVAPVIPALRTRLELSGAIVETRFRTDDIDFGSAQLTNSFQLDTTILRIPYFNGRRTRSQRTILTWRAVHHQPDAGLVITGTLQQSLGSSYVTEHRTDSVAFEGYVTRSGSLVPVPAAQRLDAQYRDLRGGRPGLTGVQLRRPDDWLLSLQVAKSIIGDGRLSFYFFNVLDKLAVFGGGSVNAVPSARFGAELTIPTARWWK